MKGPKPTLDQIRDQEWDRRYGNVEELAEWIGDNPDEIARTLSSVFMAATSEAVMFGASLLRERYDAHMRERVRDAVWLVEQEDRAQAASLELVHDE